MRISFLAACVAVCAVALLPGCEFGSSVGRQIAIALKHEHPVPSSIKSIECSAPSATGQASCKVSFDKLTKLPDAVVEVQAEFPFAFKFSQSWTTGFLLGTDRYGVYVGTSFDPGELGLQDAAHRMRVTLRTVVKKTGEQGGEALERAIKRFKNALSYA